MGGDKQARKERKRQREARDRPLPSAARNALTVILGEFCGTFMFLMLSFIGVQTAGDTNLPGDANAPLRAYSILYIASAFGAALTVNVWIFFRVTGGMFNPAVTLGLVLVRAVTPLRGVMAFITQIVAGIAAAAVVDGLLPGPLSVSNKLSHGTRVVQGLFIEMFLTSQLVLTVYFLAVEKHRATYLAPIGIGISVFIAHITGVNWTGTGINPARSFGPEVISGFQGYDWIYWLGPFMGSGLAFVVYKSLKWLDYHTANPGQDASEADIEAARDKQTAMNEKGHAPHPSDSTGASDQRPLRQPATTGTRNDSVVSDANASGSMSRNGDPRNVGEYV